MKNHKISLYPADIEKLNGDILHIFEENLICKCGIAVRYGKRLKLYAVRRIKEMLDPRVDKFLVLEGYFENGGLIAISAHEKENDALEMMKERILKSKSPYMVVEIKHLSDDYSPSFCEECERDISIKRKMIDKLQSEIDDLTERKERSINHE